MTVVKHIFRLSIGYVSLGLLGQIGSMIVISLISKRVSETEFALLVTYNALYDGALLLVGFGTSQSLLGETNNNTIEGIQLRIAHTKSFVIFNFLVLLLLAFCLSYFYDYWHLFILAIVNGLIYNQYNIYTQSYHWYNMFKEYALSVSLITILYPFMAYILLGLDFGIYSRIIGFAISATVSHLFLRRNVLLDGLSLAKFKGEIGFYLDKLRKQGVYFLSGAIKWLMKNIEVVLIPILFDLNLLAVYGASRILVRPLTFLVSNTGQGFRSYLFQFIREGNDKRIGILLLILFVGALTLGIIYWLSLEYFAHRLIQNDALIDRSILIFVLFSGLFASFNVLIKPLIVLKDKINMLVRLDFISMIITTFILVIIKDFHSFLVCRIIIEAVLLLAFSTLILWRK